MQNMKSVNRIFTIVVYLVILARVACAQSDLSTWKRLTRKASELIKLESYADAIPVAEDELRIAEKIFEPHDARLAISVQHLAEASQAMGKFSTAEPLWERALEIHNTSVKRRPCIKSVLMHGLGDVYLEEFKFYQAESLLKDALHISIVHKCSERPNVEETLGRVYQGEGKFVDAEPLLRDSVSIFKHRGKKKAFEDIARSVHNLGLLYKDEGNYVDAEKTFNESLNLSQTIPDKQQRTYELGVTMGELGAVYVSEKRYSAAEPILKKSLELRKSVVPEHPMVAANLNNLGTLYRYEKRYPEAKKFYHDALTMLTKGGAETPSMAHVLNNLGELYKAEGKDAEAVECLQKALSIMENRLGPNAFLVTAPLYNLAGTYWAQGKYSEAEPLLDRGINNLQRQFNQHFRYMSEEERLRFLGSTTKLVDAYLNFGISYSAQQPMIAAKMYDFILWEKGLVATSMAALWNQVQLTGDNHALQLLQELTQKKSTLTGLSYALLQGVPVKAATIAQLDDEANALQRELIRQVPSLAETYNNAPPSWHEVQKMLHSGEAAIEFVRFEAFDGRTWTGHFRYAAFVITSRTTTAPVMVVLDNAEDREGQALRDYCMQIALPDDPGPCRQTFSPEKSTKGETLSFYKLFWEPLTPYLDNATRIYISTDGILTQVALDIVPDERGNRLIDKYDIRIVNSTRDLVRQPQALTANSAVLVGNPQFSLSDRVHRRAVATRSDGAIQRSSLRETARVSRSLEDNAKCEGLPKGGKLCPLKGTHLELKEIYDLLIHKQWTVPEPYEGPNALEEVVKSVRHPRILHLATHGFFLPDQPFEKTAGEFGSLREHEEPMIRSGLYFAGAGRVLNGRSPLKGVDDSVLTALEASTLDLHGTELVILSACDTGLGRVQAGGCFWTAACSTGSRRRINHYECMAGSRRGNSEIDEFFLSKVA
jgi:tetratricopeptide (TPR) repeat protein